MNSKEHIEQAERWLEEAKNRYRSAYVSETQALGVSAAAMIARTHAILAVQTFGEDDGCS